MADNTVVHIGENSPEEVAYKLLQNIASQERKTLIVSSEAERKWLLDTYAECLMTVRNPSGRSRT
jgi:hypothetical protein